MGEFRIKKLPKDEKSMKSIIDEIQSKENEAESNSVHQDTHNHHHTHGHEAIDISDALIHTLDHMLGQMTQIDERVARAGRSLDEIARDVSEVKKLMRILVKLQLASITDNRNLKKELIKNILNDL